MGRVLGIARRHLGRVAAVALVASSLAACGGKKGDSSSPTTTSTSAAKPESIQGKANVVGDITTMSASGAAIDPIATPFTFTVPDAGRGGLDLPQAIVDGKSNAIVWTGGRPLPVTGTCKLDVGEADVQVGGTGAQISLDGAVRALTAGTCAFGSSVAVGAHGISNSVDSVSFTLPRDADFTTSGGAAVVVPAARRYEGRTGKLGLAGRLRVTTVDDEFNAASLSVVTGTWVVTVSATNAGVLHVVAAVEGSLLVTRR